MVTSSELPLPDRHCAGHPACRGEQCAIPLSAELRSIVKDGDLKRDDCDYIVSALTEGGTRWSGGMVEGGIRTAGGGKERGSEKAPITGELNLKR